MEWGIGQVLPLKKDMSMLAQLGLVGYDQWQVTANGGTIPNPLPIGPPSVAASRPLIIRSMGLASKPISFSRRSI